LFNFSDKEFQIKAGDRIAQLIIEQITETQVVEVDNLDETERGVGGFGSTGVSLNSGSNSTNKKDDTSPNKSSQSVVVENKNN
jgi:hypothetical protein